VGCPHGGAELARLMGPGPAGERLPGIPNGRTFLRRTLEGKAGVGWKCDDIVMT